MLLLSDSGAALLLLLQSDGGTAVGAGGEGVHVDVHALRMERVHVTWKDRNVVTFNEVAQA